VSDGVLYREEEDGVRSERGRVGPRCEAEAENSAREGKNGDARQQTLLPWVTKNFEVI
jgi:hypothetical protein